MEVWNDHFKSPLTISGSYRLDCQMNLRIMSKSTKNEKHFAHCLCLSGCSDWFKVLWGCKVDSSTKTNAWLWPHNMRWGFNIWCHTSSSTCVGCYVVLSEAVAGWRDGRRAGSPHQLCLLWKLAAAVGSFTLAFSLPLDSLCSPHIASYVEKPSDSFSPTRPRSQSPA